jgi:membrane protease YdiL (CAAX protease family)
MGLYSVNRILTAVDVIEAVAPAIAVAPERQSPQLWRHGLALLIGSGLMYAWLIYDGSYYDGEWAPSEQTAFDFLYYGTIYLVAGGGWLLLSLRFISRETLASLNMTTSTLWEDVRSGFTLCFTAIVLGSIADWIIYNLPGFTETAASQDISDTTHMGFAMVMATVFYSWTAAAVFEEFLRGFTISRLMKFGDSQAMRIAAVGITTVLFGAYHLYYGVYGALSVTVFGLIFGIYYIRHGRIVPLILAHGLYDTWSTLYDLNG